VPQEISTTTTITRSGELFDDLVTAMQRHFDAVIERNGPSLFRVDPFASGSVEIHSLWEWYLTQLPAADVQHHSCHACQQFMRHYGNLVSINDDGTLVSAIWSAESAVPEPYRAAVHALARSVTQARVTDVALTRATVWGTPVTGEWTHFAITPPAAALYMEFGALTAHQAEAKRREDFGTLRQGLLDYNRDTVAQALTLLDADALYRADKVIGPARFLLRLHDQRVGVHNQRLLDNLLWRAVATAPVGFCQPRSTMIGTLLDDILSGYSFAQIKQRFDAKMHPLQYQRPTAAPAAGNIAQAEKTIEQLGITASLRRRFARLDEIETIWCPAPPAAPTQPEGVFSHLRAKNAPRAADPLVMPPQVITWVKFAETVLPQAEQIEVFVSGAMNFCALLTAVDADAPPILQWDRVEARNPVSWYVYASGSLPERWSLHSASFVPATAVTYQPSMWGDPAHSIHHGKGAIIILDGARDTEQSGLALFPETLQASLHGIRATIEAYSRTQQLEGREEASACGVRISAESPANVALRVRTALGWSQYRIDRWD